MREGGSRVVMRAKKGNGAGGREAVGEKWGGSKLASKEVFISLHALFCHRFGYETKAAASLPAPVAAEGGGEEKKVEPSPEARTTNSEQEGGKMLSLRLPEVLNGMYHKGRRELGEGGESQSTTWSTRSP